MAALSLRSARFAAEKSFLKKFSSKAENRVSARNREKGRWGNTNKKKEGPSTPQRAKRALDEHEIYPPCSGKGIGKGRLGNGAVPLKSKARLEK